ncbi:MAG: ABC transporter ATP-binding protein, partial [Deltaproteobacteria bacterium]|nr:ABC transporter ATP-binding protein [Deltaproteobacteria bacterium]
MPPAIILKGISKGFKQTTLSRDYITLKSLLLNPFSRKGRPKEETRIVFQDLDLEIPQGISLGVIGRNGSGKSTLLKVMTGIYKPNSGTVLMNGRVSSLIELGAGFHPEFTGRENVFINGTILGLSRKEIEKRFDRIVRFAELESFIDVPVRTYSSGMYVRLGFSVAVNVDPDILLVDEVLAVGDESFSRKCIDKMTAFKKAGKTIVLVTHDLPTVERFCDQALWLESGCIQTQGDPRQVIDAYRQEVARRDDARFKEEQTAACNGTERFISRSRWGNGDIEITGVRLLDDRGQERHVFQDGEDLLVEINFQVHRHTPDVVFGVALFDGKGTCCYGTNTQLDEISLPPLSDVGRIGVAFEKVHLVEGTYLLDVAVHARDGHAYDYQSGCSSFAVRSAKKDTGIYRIPHR